VRTGAGKEDVEQEPEAGDLPEAAETSPAFFHRRGAAVCLLFFGFFVCNLITNDLTSFT
jgi:hypothetical protein